MLRSYSFVILLVISFYQVYAEELPSGLYELMEKHDCSEIMQDYDNSGDNIVGPLYVYGYLDGAKEDSIVFWCEADESEDEYYKYKLMVYTREEDALRCPPIVYKEDNIASGMFLYKDLPYNLNFSGFDTGKMIENLELTECVPVRAGGNSIEINYNGVSYVFYCDVDSGSWLSIWLH